MFTVSSRFQFVFHSFFTQVCSLSPSDPRALLGAAAAARLGPSVRPSLQPPVASAVRNLHLVLSRGQHLHLVAHLLGLQDAVAVVEAQHVCGGGCRGGCGGAEGGCGGAEGQVSGQTEALKRFFGTTLHIQNK